MTNYLQEPRYTTGDWRASHLGRLLGEALRRFDARVSLWVREAVEQYKSKVAEYVSEKVKSWDSQELVQKLELSVGKDLQFIRINGTLVGGLVGLLIYALSQWLLA